MTTAIRYWRVTFTDEGKVYTVREIEGPGHDEWVVVRAADEEQARTKAIRLYCARKKKLAKARHHAEGRCACGRQQDRQHPDGKPMLTCSVCAVRQKTYNERSAQRTESGAPRVRDEAARVTVNLERQRDRRAEIRLETLVEVRTAWERAVTIGHFSKWLASELKSLTTGSASGLATIPEPQPTLASASAG